MKKTLLFSVFLLSLFLVHAQNGDRVFNPWKVDLSLGGAIPQGPGSKGGGLFVVEPKYAVVDQFWVGLRIETAVMARSYQFSDGSSSSTNVSASGSYLATGDFYFTTENFRPFIGLGAGVYRLASISIDENGNNDGKIAASTKFGGMARVGFEAGHFRLGVEYNLLANTSLQVTDYTSSSVNQLTTTYKNSYLGIKLGVVLGGRRL